MLSQNQNTGYKTTTFYSFSIQANWSLVRSQAMPQTMLRILAPTVHSLNSLQWEERGFKNLYSVSQVSFISVSFFFTHIHHVSFKCDECMACFIFLHMTLKSSQETSTSKMKKTIVWGHGTDTESDGGFITSITIRQKWAVPAPLDAGFLILK